MIYCVLIGSKGKTYITRIKGLHFEFHMKGRMIYSEEYSSCSKDMQSEVHCALRRRNKGINKHSAESTTAGLEFHIEFGK